MRYYSIGGVLRKEMEEKNNLKLLEIGIKTMRARKAWLIWLLLEQDNILQEHNLIILD